MKAIFIMAGLALATATFTGCKNDSEDDILGQDNGGKDTTVVVPGKVVLNEICGKQDPDDDWIELLNTGDSDADLTGAVIVKTDEEGKDEDIFVFPKGYTVKKGEHKVIATLSGELQAGISNKKEVGLRIVAADKSVMDKFDRDSDIGKDVQHDDGGSYARMPDGTGKWAVTAKATRGTANK